MRLSRQSTGPHVHSCFNPHPPSRMDATQVALRRGAVNHVSIPIHPRGWMRRGGGHARAGGRTWFQSPSTLADGCDACNVPGWMAPDCQVSIPIHPRGWMRRHLKAYRHASLAPSVACLPCAPVPEALTNVHHRQHSLMGTNMSHLLGAIIPFAARTSRQFGPYLRFARHTISGLSRSIAGFRPRI